MFSVKKGGILNLYEPPHGKGADHERRSLTGAQQACCRLQYPRLRVTPPFAGLENFDYGLRKALDPEFDWQEFGYTLLKHTPEETRC